MIIQNMDSIEKCIVKRALHEQEIQKRLKRLNDRKLMIQECKVQEVKALNASLVFTESSGIDSGKHNESYRSGNKMNSSGNESSSYGKEATTLGK
ncbi:hypothetical protein Tco_1105683 [Tanacetum coccineum]